MQPLALWRALVIASIAGWLSDVLGNPWYFSVLMGAFYAAPWYLEWLRALTEEEK